MTERPELQEALALALGALDAGADVESVLVRQPAQAAELRPLLRVAQLAGAGAELARVPAGAAVTSRAQFVARAYARPAAAVATVRRGDARPPASAGRSLLAQALAIGLVVVGTLAAGGYGAVNASAQSLPGDPLYGIKRTVEQTRLLLAADNRARQRLQTEFDDRRVSEVHAVATQGRSVPVEFTGTLEAMSGTQPQRWTVAGLTLTIGAGIPIDGQPSLGAQVHVEGTVQAGGVVQAEHVTVLSPEATSTEAPSETETANTPESPSETAPPFELVQFSGVVQTVGAEAWQIGDQKVAIQSSTEIEGNPQVGQVVDVRAWRRTDGALFAQRISLAAGGSAQPSNTPSEDHEPTATQAASPTEHRGDASHTPGPTEGGGAASRTPEPTEGGGASASSTPKPTEGGDHSASATPPPTEQDGGHSPSPTPKPSERGDGRGSPTAIGTPRPTITPTSTATPTPTITPTRSDS